MTFHDALFICGLNFRACFEQLFAVFCTHVFCLLSVLCYGSFALPSFGSEFCLMIFRTLSLGGTVLEHMPVTCGCNRMYEAPGRWVGGPVGGPGRWCW